MVMLKKGSEQETPIYQDAIIQAGYKDKLEY